MDNPVVIFFSVIGLFFLIVCLIVAISCLTRKDKTDSTSSATPSHSSNASRNKRLQWDAEIDRIGMLNANLFCPHCQMTGKVHTKAIQKKAGISGGKATAAVLTGGVTLLATGLSRKEDCTQAHCDNCGSTWFF